MARHITSIGAPARGRPCGSRSLRYDRYAQDAGFRIQISSFGELQISRTDVIIRAFAARLTVGTEAHHINLPVQAGLQIFIRATSGGMHG